MKLRTYWLAGSALLAGCNLGGASKQDHNPSEATLGNVVAGNAVIENGLADYNAVDMSTNAADYASPTDNDVIAPRPPKKPQHPPK